MCGIAGILSTRSQGNTIDPRSIVRMTDAMRHRGPDGEGFWSDHEAGVTLGHRRLAIIDLTDAGHQPMHSPSGRYVITFNGEIYNFRALRQQLLSLGFRFRGDCDTEVLLAAIENWGLEAALQRSIGMFAFGLWDRKARILHLARDRIGKKPLYVARTPIGLAFASELKAIRAFSRGDLALSQPAISAFLTQGRIPEEHCIWSDVFKIPPAGLLSIRLDSHMDIADSKCLQSQIRTWWSLPDAARDARSDPLSGRDSELVARLDDLLRVAVRERMVADVPIGAFLSGGIDSSTVVAMMQAQSARPIRTFTIAFDEQAYDESSHAALVARHLGTDHTEVRLTSADARNVIPTLPGIWDEPFADESEIPAVLISQVAKKHVTVALSGDGGDECFAGYTRHLVIARFAHILTYNLPLRRMAARLLAQLSDSSYIRLPDSAALSNTAHRMLKNDGIRRLGNLIGCADDEMLYEQMTRLSELTLTPAPQPPEHKKWPELDDPVSTVLLRDMATYLPSDILVKLDRASMASSLEARCPILDQRVIDFAWRLPTNTKIRHGRGKWILRQVLAGYLPRRLFERPKQGFDVPVGAWLKGPLRGWASDLLSESRLRRQGLLDVFQVQSCWREHLAGERDHSRILWALLMLQAWLDTVGASVPAESAALTLEGI
jgi:asparagine synthase (glutamine-hydrolysing)